MATFKKPNQLYPKNNVFIPSDQDYEFSWETTTPFVDYRIYGKKKSDNSTIYDSTLLTSPNTIQLDTEDVVKFKTTHTIPSGSFTSVVGQNMYWTVEISDGVDPATVSKQSFFTAYATPTISFSDPTIPPSQVLTTQDYTFVCNYTSTDGLALQRFQFIRWDSTGSTIVFDSGEKYGTYPSQISQGMARGETFQAEMIGFPEGDFPQITTGKQTFSIDNFDRPDETPEITATENNSTANIVISWADLIALIGTTTGTTSFVTAKFNQGLQIDDSSSYLEFDYNINANNFTKVFYLKQPYDMNGSFLKAYDSLLAVNMELGYEISTNRFYVIKDGATNYSPNIVTPYTLNGFAGQSLNAFSGQTLANLGISDFTDNFMFVIMTKDRVKIILDTPLQTVIDDFTYSRTTETNFGTLRFIGKGIYDHIHIHDVEYTDIQIGNLDTETETTWGVDTLFLAKLDGDLNAGNLVSAEPVTGWRIKRKLVGSLTTETLIDVDKDILTYTDTTAGNGKEYEYSVFALSGSNESLAQTDTAKLNFFGTAITDGVASYIIDADLGGAHTSGNETFNKAYTVHNTGFADKPKVDHALMKYASDTVSGVLYQCIDDKIVATTEDQASEFEAFINNGQTKKIKLTRGTVYNVSTTDLSFETDNKLSENYDDRIILPLRVSFNWVETEEE